MKQKELSNLSYEELKQKKTSLQTVTWMLTIVLIGSLGFFIFISINDGFTPLLAVPFALSAILTVNYKNIKKLTHEMETRKSKI